MTWIGDNKGQGAWEFSKSGNWIGDNRAQGLWEFSEQEDKWGYLNNKRWSSRAEAIAFCEKYDLSLDLLDQHSPCGHWHRVRVSEKKFPSGRWVAAMSQPNTPYIYVYDITQKAVIRIDTSVIPVFVANRLEINSTYGLDYDMGRGNPGSQYGGYCMNKDGSRIWYLFTDATGNRSDAELIEVDISQDTMIVVGSTLFNNLVPSSPWPSSNNERINDGCSDDTYTYWCTNLIAGRVIKIRNSDHSIINDHTFNYAIQCGGGGFDAGIASIDFDKNTEKLYWIYCRNHLGCSPEYNACRHLIQSNTNLAEEVDEVTCGTGIHTPGWQNMIRIYSNHILHHQAYYPGTGLFMKRTLDFSKEDTVTGSHFYQWCCIKDHHAAMSDRPTSGANYATYWGVWDQQLGGNVWQAGKAYHSFVIEQEYLQNILGVKDGNVFTLMHLSSVSHPAFLYCINFSNMEEVSKLDVTSYTGQEYPSLGLCDWTSVSALNDETGVIAIFRYYNAYERNYVACFSADSSLDRLCDVALYAVRQGNEQKILDEPQVWAMSS